MMTHRPTYERRPAAACASETLQVCVRENQLDEFRLGESIPRRLKNNKTDTKTFQPEVFVVPVYLDQCCLKLCTAADR